MTSPSHTRSDAQPVTVTHEDKAARDAFKATLDEMSDRQISAKFENENKRYKSMRGRGRESSAIVDPALYTLRSFLIELGPMPTPDCTVDRIDNNNPCYEPGNVRWATVREQANNRSNTRVLTIDGQTRPLTEWADRAGVRANTIRKRLGRGASDLEAVYPERTPPADPIEGASITQASQVGETEAGQWLAMGCTPANWEPYFRVWRKRFAREDPRATRALFALYICRNALAARNGWDATSKGPYPRHPSSEDLEKIKAKAVSRMSITELQFHGAIRQTSYRPQSPEEAANLAKKLK